MFVSLGIAPINRNDSKRSGCHERSKETFSMKTDRDHGNRRAPQREPPCTLVLIVWGEPGGTCSLFLSVHQTVIRRQTRGRRSRPSGAGIPRQGIDWSLTAEITYAWAARNKTQTRRNIILTFPLRASRSAGPAHVKREPRGSRTLPQRLKIRSQGKRHWKLTGASWKYHTAPINTMKRILRLPISLLSFLIRARFLLRCSIDPSVDYGKRRRRVRLWKEFLVNTRGRIYLRIYNSPLLHSVSSKKKPSWFLSTEFVKIDTKWNACAVECLIVVWKLLSDFINNYVSCSDM